MVPYILLLALAVFFPLFAMSRYLLLDTRPAMGVFLSLFLIAAVSITINIVQYRGNNGSRSLRLAFFVSCLALFAFAILLLVNGGQDRSPANEVNVTVLQKTVATGRRGVKQYHLFVSSWRRGVSQEDLNVGSSVFDHAVIGKSVTLKVHSGYLGLPWYADVDPDEDTTGPK